jgi:DNA-directed RNA polymerase specialized sigma24 family protein
MRHARHTRPCSSDLLNMDSPVENSACRTQHVWAEFIAALGAMDPQVRAAFLLHEVFEADYAETARLVGLPVEQCRTHVEHARERAGSEVLRLAKGEVSRP